MTLTCSRHGFCRRTGFGRGGRRDAPTCALSHNLARASHLHARLRSKTSRTSRVRDWIHEHPVCGARAGIDMTQQRHGCGAQSNYNETEYNNCDDCHRCLGVARRQPGVHRVLRRDHRPVVGRDPVRQAPCQGHNPSPGAKRCSAAPTLRRALLGLRHRSRTSGSTTPTRTSGGARTSSSSVWRRNPEAQSAGGWNPDHPHVRGGPRHRRRPHPCRLLRTAHLPGVWWQKRGKVTQKELPTSTYGRPLVRKA